MKTVKGFLTTGLALCVFIQLSGLCAAAVGVNELPTGGKIVAGSGSISQSGNTMTINQTSDRMAADWNTFNIGQQASVRFNQPDSSSVALNRITDQNPSQILGSLSANGKVFLLNSAGIIFGQSARVNVGGLVASSLDLSNADFMKGNYTFTNNGSAGEIKNLGAITANGGVVAFIAPKVTNSGTITTDNGTTALVSGNQVTLDFNGDGLLNYTVDKGAVNALAENDGLIKADGGVVVMTARAADELTSAVVNNEGVVEAQTIQEKNGHIFLLADKTNGETVVGGTLDASAPDGGDGGLIETSAATVNVKDTAKITTRASDGDAGEWLLDPVDVTIAASGGDVTGATIASALATTDVTIDTNVSNPTDPCTGVTCGSPADSNGDITVDDNINVSGGSADTTLTLKAYRSITLNSSKTISRTGSYKLNTIFWTDSTATGDGAIDVAGTITTNGGYLVLAGGADDGSNSGTAGDGIPDGYADAATLASTVGVHLESTSSLTTDGGYVLMRGKNTDSGSNANGITFDGTISTGSGNVTATGVSNTRGINVGSDASITTTSGSITLNGTSSGDIGLMLQGVSGVGTDLLTTGSGSIRVTGSGNSSYGGLRVENARILSSSGSITLDGSNSGSNNGIEFDTYTRIGYKSGGTSTSNITLIADRIGLGSGVIQSSGTLTVKPKTGATTIGIAGGTGTLSVPASYFSSNFTNGFSGIIVGSSTAGAITLGGATTFQDSTTLQTNSTIAINGAVTADENLSLTSAGAITQSAALSVTGTTAITAGSGNDVTLDNSSNDFTGAVSLVSAKNLSLIDSSAMSLGAVSSSGTINAATLTGDLTLTDAVTTTDTTSSALTLNAGKNTAAGTSTGGNIIVSGGSLSVGSGGRSTLYSGSVSNSTGLTALIGSGSGNFRYDSDESVSNFSTALSSGNYAVYREQPTATITADDDSQTYTGTGYSGGNGVTASGLQNGDTSAQAFSGSISYGGTSQGAINVGTYTITPSGYTSLLGYALSYANGTLTITAAASSSSTSATNINTVVRSLTSIQKSVNGTQDSDPGTGSGASTGGQMTVTYAMGPGAGSNTIDMFSRFKLIDDRR